MDRYTYLYGTNESGVYCPMGYSDGLPVFLQKLGSVSHGATIDVVRRFVNGYRPLETDGRNKDSAAVAVRYAPMHLHRLPNMPSSMRPFCAMGISGGENIEGKRESNYDKTVFISAQLMLNSWKENGEKYCYLDQLFGTHILSWQEMRDHRLNIERISCDELPAKVEPKLRNRDFAIVINAIKAIFEGKSVLIRLEKGADINERAWQILTQIYSLFHPMLATEIGFAVYVDEQNIVELRSKTSVRIFVVPAEFNMDSLPNSEFLKLDINDVNSIPTVDKKEKATRAICLWASLDWQRRQEAMESQFKLINQQFLDGNEFVRITETFFSNSFFSWLKDPRNAGTISSLEELKQLYDQFPICKQLSWAREMFKAQIPTLMERPDMLEELVSEKYAALVCGDQRMKELAEFGIEMGGGNLEKTSRLSALLGQRIGFGKGEEERVRLEKELGEKEIEREQAVKTAIANCEERRIADVNAEREKNRIAEASHKAYREETETKIDRLKETLEKAACEKEQAVIAAKQECERQRLADVNAEKEKTRELETIHGRYVEQTEEKIKLLNKTIDEVKIEKEQAVIATKQECERRRVNDVNAEREKTSAVEATLRTYADKAETAIKQLKEEKKTLDNKLRQGEEKADEADRRLQEAQSLYKKAQEMQNTVKRQRLISALVGFLVALVILSMVFLVKTIFFGPGDDENVMIPEETVEVVPTPDTEPMDEPEEEAEITPTPLPPPTPQVNTIDSRIAEAAQNIPGIQYIDTEMLESKLMAVEGAEQLQPMAIYSLDEENPEGDTAMPENRVVLFKQTEQTAEGAEALPADSAGPTSAELRRDAGARIVLSDEKIVVCAYGSDDAVNAAIKIFSFFTGESQTAEMKLFDRNGTDVVHLLKQVSVDRRVGSVYTDAEYLQGWKENFALNAELVMCLELDAGNALLFEVIDAEAAATEAGQIGPEYSVYQENQYIMVLK